MPITVMRYSDTTDAEGDATGTLAETAEVFGWVHELNSQEQAQAATLGSAINARGHVPYGTDIQEQDVLQVTYPDERVVPFRVIRARDNALALIVDLSAEVV
jgi:SPP1 family predicted phage head-tail adaptor